MKKILFIFLVLLFGENSFAQEFSRDYWHNGEVDLFSGDTFKGKLKYDLEKDNIVIQTEEGVIKSFSSQKVQGFQFFDALLRLPRYFHTLPFEKRISYSSPVFFELLSEGELNLLNREKITQRSIYYPSFAGGWTSTVFVLEDDYYILDQKTEKVMAFDPNTQDISQFMTSKRTEVQDFIRNNRIRTNEKMGLIRVFEFYNQKKGE